MSHEGDAQSHYQTFYYSGKNEGTVGDSTKLVLKKLLLVESYLQSLLFEILESAKIIESLYHNRNFRIVKYAGSDFTN